MDAEAEACITAPPHSRDIINTLGCRQPSPRLTMALSETRGPSSQSNDSVFPWQLFHAHPSRSK